MADLTTEEATWVKAAAAAFLAIRVASQSRPDEAQTRDINFLADALHNIGMVGTGNSMFADLHTPEDLIEVQKITQRLLHSFQKAGSNEVVAARRYVSNEATLKTGWTWENPRLSLNGVAS